ncbi:MAG TPA: nickel-dependent hydrogenase large subunit [Verrucomicrobiota bacterium]|nr:nickel-dependent hydrogenase large subunit [Verrucomicrobiota bacterium]HPY32044.1 nickel-dependent hydrogenase large subunit [Verrucomicrobiota bacterium]HQB17471.1 nickel-dependent hydrogenase large subunit [Verrucomicrobiota bacterium]
MARTVIPFGPQHPVLPEPIHLDLVIEDEKVVEARPSIGFIHRGLEKLAEKKDYVEFVYVAERICGICSFIHGQTYCQAVETIMNIQVPPRAHYLRTVWGEFSRLHSHLLWLGLMADGMGFESLFMHTWRVRERVLGIIEATTGGRVIFGSCKVGGVRRDMDADTIRHLLQEVDGIEQDLRDITRVFLNDRSVKSRLCGLGVLSKQDAWDLGCVGPMLRASGVAQDMRTLGYAAFQDIPVEPATRPDGDCYARSAVHCDELFQSVDIIRRALARIPEGEVAVKVTGNPNGETIIRTEQPRGEVVYHLKANGTKNLQRFRVRTPTFANIPAMLKILPGCDLADVPMIVLTIDPCISCTER